MSQDGKKNLRQTEDPSGGFPGVVPPQMAGTARDMRAVPEKGGSTSLGARCSLLAVTSPRGRREAHPAPGTLSLGRSGGRGPAVLGQVRAEQPDGAASGARREATTWAFAPLLALLAACTGQRSMADRSLA